MSGCSYAGVYQRNLNLHTKTAHPERVSSAVSRPRKIKNESRVKNEADSSTASESDNDEIEILSVSDAVVTLPDEDLLNSSMDCPEILEDSGINLNESGNGREEADETNTADAEFVRSLIESAFWFSVSGAEERRGGPSKDKEDATNTAKASSNNEEVVCVPDEEDSSEDPMIISVQDEEVQIIISDELDAPRASAVSGVKLSNDAMVKSIIEEVLNNVVAAGNPSTASEEQITETIVAAAASPVECVVGETIGIDEEDIVALDIAEDEGGIEVVSEVSHNDIWSLPEIIMLDD